MESNHRLLQANARRIAHDFQVGEQVLKRRGLRTSDKLKSSNTGPYAIERVHTNGTVTIAYLIIFSNGSTSVECFLIDLDTLWVALVIVSNFRENSPLRTFPNILWSSHSVRNSESRGTDVSTQPFLSAVPFSLINQYYVIVISSSNSTSVFHSEHPWSRTQLRLKEFTIVLPNSASHQQERREPHAALAELMIRRWYECNAPA